MIRFKLNSYYNASVHVPCIIVRITSKDTDEIFFSGIFSYKFVS